MQVGMKMEVLTPTVQDGEETQDYSEAMGIGRHTEQRLGSGLEEDVIQRRLVVEGDLGDGFRDGEHHVEVLHRQQLGLTLLEPFLARRSLALGAVAVPAGAVLRMRVLAAVAPFDYTAQRGSAAGFDGLHQPMLVQGQGMGLPVGRAVLSKDVGQLQGWPGIHFLARLVVTAGFAGWSSLSRGLTVAATTCGETAA